jgi:uncharacterized protein YndB with AHSA1/START domain
VATEPIRASVYIEAAPARVFRYFTDPDAMVSWMGQYAKLEPTSAGDFHVDIGGTPVRGRYLEVDPPRRLLISWGHAGSDRLPPGASTVEVLLTAAGGGTEVVIIHSGLPEPERGRHVQGWPYFLGRLAAGAAGS